MMTGVILAGGRNRRMGGQPKGLLELNGEPLVVRQLRKMKSVCAEQMIITNEPDRYRPFIDPSVRILRDNYPNQGPMGGMEAAFSAASNEYVWVVGCDMPFLSANAAKQMYRLIETGGDNAVIPIVDGRVQPLHGVYHRRCIESIRPLLETGERRLMSLLERICCRYVTVDELPADETLNMVWNMNTPDDYAETIRRINQTKANRNDDLRL